MEFAIIAIALLAILCGSAAAIEAFSGNTVEKIAANWNAYRSTGLPSPVATQGPTTQRSAQTFSFGTGAGACNQIIQETVTISASGTNNFNVSSGRTNVLGETSQTLTAIKFILVELLTTAQGGGANATSITLGNHATNAWDSGPLGATDTYTIASGGAWAHESTSAAGMSVTSGDILKIVNNDGSNAASVRITIFGLQ